MTYQPAHRKPRWHDRPRAWLRTWLDDLCGREEEWDETDDHGNHIGSDLPGYQYEPPPDSRVWQTEKLGDTHVPLYGRESPPGYNPAWAPCAFTPDVPRPGQNRPPPLSYGSAAADTGPGYRHLSMWDITICRDPWPARPAPPVTWSRPRVPRYVLAGAW